MTIRLKEAAQRLLAAAGLLVCAASPTLAEDIYAQYCEPCPPIANPCPPPVVTDQPLATPTPMGAEGQAPPVPADPVPIDLGADAPQVDLSPAPSNNALASSSASQSNFAPNMIGDTSAGGCGGLFIGGEAPVTLNHPIYACSRLNIAENNSAFVQDRLYYTYRHFRNASGFDFFSDSAADGGLARDFDTNQHTLAFEKRVGQRSSIELRVPINSQLNSDLNFVQNTSAGPFPPPGRNNLSLIDSSTDIGNIAVILKQNLYRDCCSVWSWGLGINIPTAPDLGISGDIFDSITVPSGIADVDIAFDGVYRNQTVNLQPFITFASRAGDRWFRQGFLQLDVPVNDSPGSVDLFEDSRAAAGDPLTLTQTLEAELGLQTLIRANVGVGRWLNQRSRNQRTRSALLFELHYTGTLESAERLIEPNINVGADTVTLFVGPLADNTNVLNGVVGLSTEFRETTIYNGFSFPFRDGLDRGFDFEYSFTLNRNF